MTAVGRSARLEHILRAAHDAGAVHVDELARTLGVSRMTVHRDLDELQQRGLLRKVRGGASVTPSTQFEADLDYRRRTRAPDKERIAAAAVELIDVGDVVLLDDSTSALAIVPQLERFEQLTVITNFAVAIDLLRGQDRINLISLGGQYHRRYASYLGVVCEQAIAHLAADIVFLSTSSVHDGVLFHQDESVVAAKRAMLAAAEQRVLLLDGSKLGHRALHRLCDVSEFTHVVVDPSVTPEDRRGFAERGVEVIVADAVR